MPAFGPSSGFGYPLDGFLPLGPSEFYFALTALLGFTSSKLRDIKWHHGVPTITNPPGVCHVFYAEEVNPPHGDTCRAFWVLTTS